MLRAREEIVQNRFGNKGKKLANWLTKYNTVLPHHSIKLKTPVQFLIQHQPERQRYWTCTRFLILVSINV